MTWIQKSFEVKNFFENNRLGVVSFIYTLNGCFLYLHIKSCRDKLYEWVTMFVYIKCQIHNVWMRLDDQFIFIFLFIIFVNFNNIHQL